MTKQIIVQKKSNMCRLDAYSIINQAYLIIAKSN